MKTPQHYKTLFTRHETNPILTSDNWPYLIHTVFNPGATLLADGTTLLLCRVEDRRGHSHLSAARSPNGIDQSVIDDAPTFAALADQPDEMWSVEDPRITYVESLGRYAIAYTAFCPRGPGRRTRADRRLSHV